METGSGDLISMNNAALSEPDQRSYFMNTSLPHFSLPGILPEKHRLVISLSTQHLVHLALGEGGPELLEIISLNADETHVLFALLSAFPRCCSEALALTWYTQGEACEEMLETFGRLLEEDRETTLGPLRVLLGQLNTTLHPLGIKIVQVLEHAYILQPRVKPPEVQAVPRHQPGWAYGMPHVHLGLPLLPY